VNHPKRIRHGADNAKLISACDTSGFDFHGRFETAEQACSVGLTTTQRAHNTLRWLIARQGFRNGSQAIVAWAVGGASIPPILADSSDLGVGRSDELADTPAGDINVGYDAGRELRSMLRGYRADLSDQDDVVVLALDSAVPGRLAITYYRELKGSEFLDRVLDWHEKAAWPQDMGKEKRFVGAPSPEQIAYSAFGFGRDIDDRLKRATVERLIPCILDGQSVPRDLVNACFHQVCKRAGKTHWEWEYALGVTCALIRRNRKEENYSMSLEPDRRSRSYLFGRLLAVAERIENYGLWLGNEDSRNRSTSAERLMERFSLFPVQTWQSIEIALRPYLRRIMARRPSAHFSLTRQIDEIMELFDADDFTRKASLDPEYLLGYHCQRAALRNRERSDDNNATEAQNSSASENQEA
jgi:CRISPR-associated protein Csd1